MLNGAAVMDAALLLIAGNEVGGAFVLSRFLLSTVLHCCY